MANALEARSPLLDVEVLELAASAPASVRRRGGPKGLLKEAFAADVPAPLLRRRKHGFSVPVDAWFRGSLRPLARELLLSDSARTRRWLAPAAVARLLAAHEAGGLEGGRKLWALCCLELWLRSVVEGAAARSSAAVGEERCAS